MNAANSNLDPQATQILTAALGLSLEQREEVALQLVDSLHPADAEAYDAAWEAELERRITEMDQGKTPGIPWEEVRKKMRAKL